MADNSFKISKGITLNGQASAPANPVNGDQYYDTTLQQFRAYRDGSWQSLTTTTNTDTLSNKTLQTIVGSVVTDSTTTGASASLQASAITNAIVRLTNASLVSVSGIPAGSAGQLLIVENQTGVIVTIKDEDTGTTAANRIRTGTSAAISMSTNATFMLTYDSVAARWMLTAGAGSDAGDSSSITETIKNTLVDSTYELVTPIVASIDKETKFSTLTGAAYDLSSKTIKYTANAQVATSINMIDTVELPATDISEVDLHAFWSKASGFAVPTAFTYQVSRDGGTNYQTVTMARVGTTEVFAGSHRFTEEVSFVSLASDVGLGASSTALNITTEQSLSQRVNLVNPSVVKTVDLHFNKTGSPTGNIFLTLVKNVAGVPSTLSTDIVATGSLVSIASITTGVNTLSLPTAGVASGLHHIIVNTDSQYKSIFSTGVTSLNLRQSTDISTGSTYNGTVWAAAAYGFYYSVVGRALDLKTKVTSAGSPTYPCGLTGLALYYNKQDFGVIGYTRKTQRFVFNSVADNSSSFTLTGFTPDPDLLTCYYVEAGQVFKAPAFVVNGNVISFPANSFNNGAVSATVTLIFDQNTGGSFDNSDTNALLLAANFLGSTTASIDRSQPGRGFFIRRPDGVLREVTLDNTDQIVIYSV